MARTDSLGNFLTDVANAIREKTGSEETINASQFDTAIANIPSGGGGMDWSVIGYTPESVQSDYDYSLSIKNNWVDSQNLASKFHSDNTLKYMPVVPTTNATGSIETMFYNCRNLLEIPVFTFSNEIISIAQIFRNCSNLKKVDASNWNGSKIKYVGNAFYGCSSLEFLDIRTIELSKTSSYSNIFTNVPANCLIVVKNQTEKDWVASKWNNLTNVHTVAEYEASL